jgi:hypothetical protein
MTMRKQPNKAKPKGEAETPATTTEAPPVAAAPQGPRLTDLMALQEPARTAALKELVESGASINIRSRTGKEVRVRHGAHILIVPTSPKPFTAAHAIHLLWTAPDKVEEV